MKLNKNADSYHSEVNLSLIFLFLTPSLFTFTGAEPIPESDEFPRYYTMPRTRGGNRNGQVTLECDKRERWKNSTQSSIGKGQRGSHRLDSLV